MPRTIDADALLSFVREREPWMYNTLFGIAKRFPTIEPETVRRGKWLMITDSKHCGVCSVCSRQDFIDPLATHCRYCGAKMDLEG